MLDQGSEFFGERLGRFACVEFGCVPACGEVGCFGGAASPPGFVLWFAVVFFGALCMAVGPAGDFGDIGWLMRKIPGCRTYGLNTH